MLSRLGYYADKVIEMGWLAAAVLAPLFFNVYSSRVFEPDKIAVLRSLVLLMTIAWLVKIGEGGWRSMRSSDAVTRTGKATAAIDGAATSTLPSWLGVLRVPMIVPILVYALAYLISSILTVTPDATWWGSYQRLQGTYTQYSYIMLGLIVIANLRSRKQLERLISFIILTSIPVALYGLLQAVRLDPLPWAGDTATRVASTMGNAIFVAAWLIMAVPFAIYRLLNGINGWFAVRRAPVEEVEVDNGRRRTVRRPRQAEASEYGWAVVANSLGIILIQLFTLYFAIKLAAQLPLPDAVLWPALPIALAVFYAGCWLIGWIADHGNDPAQGSTYLIATGAVLFVVSLLAFVPTWSVNNTSLSVNVSVDVVGFLWVLFFLLAWGAVTATAYSLGARDQENRNPNRGVVRGALLIGYTIVLIVQLECIYLTQSRGPWLGLGVGLVTFAAALYLIGRSRTVRWMELLGGAACGLVIIVSLFVGLLNIPSSPLQSLDGLPLVGRGIERLSTLTRTEDGTGKVRTLIWQGATQLIASNPVRAIIGYGPESMYVVYNKFYPPELAHWELRNATPDRSHNVEFDQMVTMGAMGLLTYYFLVAAFFFYAVRIAKRALSTRDQLLAVALVAAVASHFVEIQTGIQIASTWTYFYLSIAMMVAFGYYITNYLREAAPVTAEEQAVAAAGAPVDGDGVEAVPAGAGAAPARARAAVASGATLQASRSMASAAPNGNGKPTTVVASAQGGQGQKPRTRQPQTTGSGGGSGSGRSQSQAPVQGQGQGQGQSRNQQNIAEARRRSQAQQQQRYNPGTSAGQWFTSPVMLIVYAVVLVGALIAIWNVNAATVQADTLYKQGQAYDGASRWQDSIDRYKKAIELQPNQDYYYLFLGRAYLEWAKATDQDLSGNNPQTGQPYTQAQKDNERTARLLAAEQYLGKAQQLNPLNTDHYANLGRLYLYWSDPSGGKDPSKAPLSAQYMQKAVENSPGNAQLWDELAVSDARNGQFDKAMQDLQHSQQDVDPTFAQTTFIRGQLLQERANNVQTALENGTPLPTGGETDFGKLVLQAGQAFSQSIALDPAYFIDNGMQDRVEFFLSAGTPFTHTNSTVPKAKLSNVLTDTILLEYNQLAAPNEKNLADFLRGKGVYKESGNKVPDSLLQSLWNDNNWAGIRPAGYTREWLDLDMYNNAHAAVVPYAALGFMKYRLGDTQGAIDSYARAVAIDPSNYFNQKNLGSLLSSEKQCTQSLNHLKTALDVIQSDPTLSSDSTKQQDYQQISGEYQRVQSGCKP